jgi:hypothetical protein
MKSKQEAKHPTSSSPVALTAVPDLTGTEDGATIIHRAMNMGRSPTKDLLEAMREQRVMELGEAVHDPFLRLYRAAAPLAIDVQLRAMVEAEKWADRLAAARDIQDRAGLAPVKRIAQKSVIELSVESIEKLNQAVNILTVK